MIAAASKCGCGGIDLEDEVRELLLVNALHRRGEASIAEVTAARDALALAAVRRSGVTVTEADVEAELHRRVEADADEKLREMREHGVRRRGVRL